MGRGIVALSSVGLTKTFPVVDARSLWRVMVRGDAAARSVLAVDDVSLAVPKGEIVGILGRNGAGKSTLLRLLAGIYQPSAGNLSREGTITGLFELGGLGHRFLTGRQYAVRVLTLLTVDRRRIKDLVEEIAAFTELGPAFEQPMYTYSTGMAARVYFATATALEHDVYLIDEMLSVGDEHFQAKCWTRIRERLARGASGVLVTHDWSAVLRLCRRSHVMDRGRIVLSGPTDEVVRTYLRLERPPAAIARFSESNPTSYTVQSGQDAHLPFEVEILEPASVAFAFSVESLRLGEGWEILLLRDNMPVAARPGRYTVSLAVGRFPLPGGYYYLNVFLHSGRSMDREGARAIYDVRSWTQGNAVDLVVSGPARRAATLLPVEWMMPALTPAAP